MEQSWWYKKMVEQSVDQSWYKTFLQPLSQSLPGTHRIPSQLNIERFTQLYELNPHMYKAPDLPHPIDHANFLKWIDRHPTEKLRNAARDLYEKTRYVSHATFFAKYDQVCDEISRVIDSFHHKFPKENLQVGMYVGPNIKKSNFWIAVYMFSRLRDRIHFVFAKPTDHFYSIDMRTLIIFPDDACYSGRQMLNTLQYVQSYIRHEHIFNSQVQFIVASGFVSSVAKSLLQSIQNSVVTHFPECCDVFQEHSLPSGVYVMEDSMEKRRTHSHTIYFDHKLADMISIFQSIYAIGSGLEEHESNEADEEKNIAITFPYEPTSLIQNCNSFQHVMKRLPGTRTMKQQLVHFLTTKCYYDVWNVVKPCPAPPYKSMRYQFMFNSELLDLERIDQLGRIE